MNWRLNKFARKYYSFVYRMSPVTATYLGVHEYDHLLGDYSKTGIKRDILALRRFKKELNKLKPFVKRWSIKDQTDYKLVASDIELNLLSLAQVKDWQRNPNFYVEMPLIGIFLIISHDGLSPKKKFKSILSRLKFYPQVLREGRRNLKKPPKVFVEIALETAFGAKSFVSGLTKEFEAVAKLTPVQSKALSGQIEPALRALNEFEEFLRRQLAEKAVPEFALGRRLFEKRLSREHFLKPDASELYELGQKEFVRIQKELESLAATLDKNRPWQELVEEYKNVVPDADKLLELYKKEVARLVKFLRDKDLVSFPKGEKCKVCLTPEFERPTVPYAAYMPPPPFDKNQTGNFWVTPVNKKSDAKDQKEQLREHSLLSFMITTLHESYPGHHLQFSLANKNHSFVRKHGQSSLLCEGWALYCEQMMGEAGYYKDPRTRMFMLKDELWRAARVVIDAGLHCFNMSVEEAVDLLVDAVKLARAQAEAEAKRYTISPTQPMSYLVGKQLILKMRSEAQSKWGRNFSLKKFHDAFLASGTIPQPLIEKEIFESSLIA